MMGLRRRARARCDIAHLLRLVANHLRLCRGPADAPRRRPPVRPLPPVPARRPLPACAAAACASNVWMESTAILAAGDGVPWLDGRMWLRVSSGGPSGSDPHPRPRRPIANPGYARVRPIRPDLPHGHLVALLVMALFALPPSIAMRHVLLLSALSLSVVSSAQAAAGPRSLATALSGAGPGGPVPLADSIVIEKKARRLTLYHLGRPLRSYPRRARRQSGRRQAVRRRPPHSRGTVLRSTARTRRAISTSRSTSRTPTRRIARAPSRSARRPAATS